MFSNTKNRKRLSDLGRRRAATVESVERPERSEQVRKLFSGSLGSVLSSPQQVFEKRREPKPREA